MIDRFNVLEIVYKNRINQLDSPSNMNKYFDSGNQSDKQSDKLWISAVQFKMYGSGSLQLQSISSL